MIDARRFAVETPDGAIAGLRFGAPGAPPLLFAHANGFCASAYRQTLEAVEGHDIFAIDLRGHGRTTLTADSARGAHYAQHARDVGAAIDGVRRRFDVADPFTLAGHSLGAVAAAMAGASRDDIAVVRLIEPVAAPEYLRFLELTPFWKAFAERLPLAAAARRRRPVFESREKARAVYQEKALFRRFAPGVLDDYLADGARATDNGAALSCAPAWEAANFAAPGNAFWSAARSRRSSLAVLGAVDGSTALFGSAAARLARIGVTVVLAEGAGHLLPMEIPARAALFLSSGR